MKQIGAVETPHVVWKAGSGRNRLNERSGLSCSKWEVVESLGRVLTHLADRWRMSCTHLQPRGDMRIILKVNSTVNVEWRVIQDPAW